MQAQYHKLRTLENENANSGIVVHHKIVKFPSEIKNIYIPIFAKFLFVHFRLKGKIRNFNQKEI